MRAGNRVGLDNWNEWIETSYETELRRKREEEEEYISEMPLFDERWWNMKYETSPGVDKHIDGGFVT